MARKPSGPLTAREFFDAQFEGGSMTDAMRGANLAYGTVRAVASGANVRVVTLRLLDAWSRTVASAREHGAWIDAARTAGFDDAAKSR